MNAIDPSAPLGRKAGLFPLVLLALATVGCDDTTGVGDAERVALNFAVTSASAPLATGGPATVGPVRVAGPPLVLDGSNGTLTIDEIRLIVAEVELDGDDDLCEDSDGDDDGPDDSDLDDDCAEFEAPPRFLDLPLDGRPVEAFVGLVPPGVYDELEFEIEDLEDDEDEEWGAEISALQRTIRDEFPDWPSEATALVVGSFAPTGASAQDFRVYLEAEVEVERTLVPPLRVGEGGEASELTVDVRPDVWFTRGDGTVMDLTLYDYDDTDTVLEFELEIEDGFPEVEWDDR